jgi:hypothetical protein
MPVSLAQIGYTYTSFIDPSNSATIQRGNGPRAEAWRFQGRVGQCVDITMRSDDFDSFMGVYGNDPQTGELSELAADDNSGGGRTGRDAEVRRVLLSTGPVYVVVADSAGRENAGRYTLRFDGCDVAPTTSPGTSPRR